MAHIILRGQPGSGQQIIVNGVDYSLETFRGVELVSVGDDDFAEVGLRVTFAVSRLDLDAEANVEITAKFPDVAQRVHAMQEVDLADPR